jgi:hypothetical protein
MRPRYGRVYPLRMPLPAASAASGFATVIVAIVVVTLLLAGVAFSRSESAWSSIGRGPLSIDDQAPPSAAPTGSPTELDRAAQAAEVRQMLEARAERARLRGEKPVDVEAEAARLLSGVGTAADLDDELRAEVRQLVVARNERRARQGLEPLDVAAETERQLADLAGG